MKKGNLLHLLLLLGSGISVIAHGAGKTSPCPIPARENYLLLDHRVVQSVENAVLQIGTVEKRPEGPVFGEDLPWEQNTSHHYASVVFDDTARIYRMWYYSLNSPVVTGQRFWIRDITPGSLAPDPFGPPVTTKAGLTFRALKENTGSDASLLYATSRDGIHWEKPALDVYRYQGRGTNIVILYNYATGVFRDARDPDPSRRYKLINNGGWMPEGRIHVAFSPDGIIWSDVVDTKVTAAGDTHNNAIWASDLGRYVAITRGWSQGAMGWNLPDPLPWKKLVGGVRTTVRIESEDFVHWSQPVEVLRGPPHAQIYSMPIFAYGGVYLGLPAIFRAGADNRVQTELAWSPDTKGWSRLDEGAALIPLGREKSDPDWGCIYAAAAPLVAGDKILIYYAGESRPHGVQPGVMCLATLRLDGWAGYTARDETRPAVVLTEPLACTGGTLRITADVGVGGSVQATVTDLAGHVLAAGSPVTATVTAGVAARLEGRQGQWVQVKFELRKAKLYSLAFGP